jgi:hypothetical protein
MASKKGDGFHDEASGNSGIDLPKAATADSSGDVAGHPLKESSTDLFEKETTELRHVERRLFKDVGSLSRFLRPRIQLSHHGFEFLLGICRPPARDCSVQSRERKHRFDSPLQPINDPRHRRRLDGQFGLNSLVQIPPALDELEKQRVLGLDGG